MSESSTYALKRAAAMRGTLRGLLHDYMELAKVRLSAMVVVTTAVGFIAASRGGIEWTRLLWTVIGTFLAAIGASAFNQAIEAPRDARMNRTRHRPIPAGRMSRRHAALFAMWASVIGIAILCPGANGLTAILGLANILIYVLIYTPLKPVSTLNTLVGGVVGALPPMMGWAAAAGDLSLGAWVLGALLFMWQIPHFLALAWMYRKDYAQGGYRMLPVVDPTGRRTALFAILYALALVPIGFVLGLSGATGLVFAVGAAALGYWLFLRALIFARQRTDDAARKLFLCSIIYLPLMMMLIVVDARHPREAPRVRTAAGFVDPAAVVHPSEIPAMLGGTRTPATPSDAAPPDPLKLPAP